MFCALNGATDTPLLRSQAQIAVAIQLLPAFDDVPPTKSGRAFTRPIRDCQRSSDSCHRDADRWRSTQTR